MCLNNNKLIIIKRFQCHTDAVVWLKYCRYGVNLYSINRTVTITLQIMNYKPEAKKNGFLKMAVNSLSIQFCAFVKEYITNFLYYEIWNFLNFLERTNKANICLSFYDLLLVWKNFNLLNSTLNYVFTTYGYNYVNWISIVRMNRTIPLPFDI